MDTAAGKTRSGAAAETEDPDIPPERDLNMEVRPVLWIVIPCYNEEQLLPLTAPLFLQKLKQLEEVTISADMQPVVDALGDVSFAVRVE